MQYIEILAQRIVTEAARGFVPGLPSEPIMLHQVAHRLKIDEASAESTMHRAVTKRWLVYEGTSLFRIQLTEAGRTLSATL